jgi:multidrug efflux system membrane fusion protein
MMEGPTMRRLDRLLPVLAMGLAMAAGEPPRPVRVAAVVIAPDAGQLVLSGTVQARIQADLGFRVGGKVAERPVDIGDHVHAGQVLARLDETDLALSEQSAEAAMRAAQADAANSRALLDRYQRLGRGSPAFVPADYDQRAATSRMADARLEQANRQLALAHSQRGYGVLTADADGVVTSLPVQHGQVVAAGQVAATLAHGDAIEIQVDVPENRLAAVRAADRLDIRLWAAPDTQLHGRVREIGGLADAATRTFATRISVLDAPDGLLALGMTATVTVPQPGPPLARLPATALADAAGQPAVWVLDPARQHAALRPITLAGYADDGSLLVRDGLAAGELVVTAGIGEITPALALTVWPGAVR